MFKKTAIAALVLGFSGAASAAMYAPAPAPACSAGNVTVPCERSAWDLGADLLYWRASESQFSGVTNNWLGRWGFGFRVEGSYHFGTGNDATINWAHFNRGTNRNGTMQRSRVDLVNLEIGQHADFGENVDLRFHGGVQYANYRDGGVGGRVAGVANFRTTAFGPRVGADASYDFGNGFGFFANSGVGLLTAKTTAGARPVPAAVARNTYHSQVSTDVQLGVKYTQAMAQGDLTGHVGWEQHDFVNGNILTDVAWHGVFVGLKWVGNA